MNKTIFLRTLILHNFKGIKDLTINFNDQENSIKGENATGKTSVMDAFTYLLFDKDSCGREKFNIKPLAESGEAIHRQETEVSAILLVNDETITLRKVYKEKYTKPRGQSEEVFDGHTTTYYYNDVPLAQRDYQAKIEAICPEKIFKLLTNPIFFPGLNWSEQRSMLISIAGKVNDEDIASVNPAFAELIKSIGTSKTVEEYKREIAMKKKRIKEDLEQIPARIDEVQRAMPEVQNWISIAGQIADIQNAIADIDSRIADKSKGLESDNSKRLELQKKINEHKSSKTKIEQEATTHIDNLRFDFERKLRLHDQDLKDLEETISQNLSRITGLEASVQSLHADKQKKVAEWHRINEEKMVEFSDDNVCPTCKQTLPDDMIKADKERSQAEFNQYKANKIAINVKEGTAIKNSIIEAEAKITTCKNTVKETEVKLSELKLQSVKGPDYDAEKKAFLAANKYTERTQIISDLEIELQNLGPVKVADTSVLKEEKRLKSYDLDELKRLLATRDQITAGNTRIEKLRTDQQNLSQELADFEKIEFTIAGFSKAKIEAVENKINGMFRIVRFKMFNQQVNGGEQETCECTVDGVPYSDLNNAMKINAGIDILSTLGDKYGIKAPIFLDNRESVNKILAVKAQLINLVVTKDKQLVFN